VIASDHGILVGATLTSSSSSDDDWAGDTEDHGCWIELLPPSSSDQTQPCDVAVFDPLKVNMTTVQPADDLSKQSKQVLKILGALQTTLLPPTIIIRFHQTGIESHDSDEHDCLICRVNMTCARHIRGVNTTGIDVELLSSNRSNRHGVRLS
jgi:hypothetical protein